MRFKAVLFDCDGLMFNTEKVWQHYFIKANAVFNQNFTEADRVKIVGKSETEIRQYLKEVCLGLDVDEYREWIRQSVQNHIDKQGVEAKKGLKEIIEFCNQNNIKMAIVSGSRKVRIEKYLETNQISKTNFRAFVTGEQSLKAKPAPDFYLSACKQLDVKLEDCVVLEDSYLGVEAGRNAGCFTIMIPDTMPVNAKMQELANLILNDLNEVTAFLKNS